MSCSTACASPRPRGRSPTRDRGLQREGPGGCADFGFPGAGPGGCAGPTMRVRVFGGGRWLLAAALAGLVVTLAAVALGRAPRGRLRLPRRALPASRPVSCHPASPARPRPAASPGEPPRRAPSIPRASGTCSASPTGRRLRLTGRPRAVPSPASAPVARAPGSAPRRSGAAGRPPDGRACPWTVRSSSPGPATRPRGSRSCRWAKRASASGARTAASRPSRSLTPPARSLRRRRAIEMCYRPRRSRTRPHGPPGEVRQARPPRRNGRERPRTRVPGRATRPRRPRPPRHRPAVRARGLLERRGHRSA